MGYYDVSQLSVDKDFAQRCMACYAVEGLGGENPNSWWGNNMWTLAAQPGFGDAYTSAVLNNVPNPGRDQSVISDAQILSAVQALPKEDA